jgi:hypothetical protein
MIAFSMVLALAPLSGIVAAALLALGLGCKINDAAMEPCHAYGTDFAEVLSNLALTEGLGGPAYVLLAFVLILWGAIELVAIFARWWQSRSQA